VLHETGVAVRPLKLTVLDPWVAPKFAPVIVTVMPMAPVVGDNDVRTGGGLTVKLRLLLLRPNAVTTTPPVVAPAGTNALICVALHVVGVAGVPLNVTVLLPCVGWK
jgi:hypothetical protein